LLNTIYILKSNGISNYITFICWIYFIDFHNIFKPFQDLLLCNKINNNATNLSSIIHVFHHLTLNQNQTNRCRILLFETWFELLNYWIELIWGSSSSKKLQLSDLENQSFMTVLLFCSYILDDLYHFVPWVLIFYELFELMTWIVKLYNYY
jgi:hypothetical protein